MLKKGYNIIVHSWENDADYRNKEIINVGENKNHIDFYQQVLEIFKSKNNSKTEINLGNTFDDEIEEYIVPAISYIKEVAEKTGFNLSSLNFNEEDHKDNLMEYYEDWLKDFASNLLDTSEHYSFRVFDSIEVFYSIEIFYVKEEAEKIL